MRWMAVVLGVALVVAAGAADSAGADNSAGAEELVAPPPDLVGATGDVEAPPEAFARFQFAGHEAEAQALNHYLWYHFRKRGGIGPTVFNKEYLATSDLWMGGAIRPDWPNSAQETLRADLLAIPIDREGYVHTGQHYSHAHEYGWPFPLWIHNPTGEQGLAAGWHFQEDGPGWVWDTLRRDYPNTPWAGAKAIEGWQLENVRSLGIVEKKWRIEATGPSPAIVTPERGRIVAFNAPFLQLRWKRNGESPSHALPYVEWMREEDTAFAPERRMYFGFDSGNPGYESVTGATHCMIPVYRHPLWKGYIKRIRIALAPGESAGTFDIDSFFTVYDTRHTINNPIYILACSDYFRWSGDLAFLRRTIGPMRLALRSQQTELGGLAFDHIRNTWVGHDGLPGFTVNDDGSKTTQHGHGIGSNYWDILPFGWDDFYATYQYYAATLAMADLEEACTRHPEWDIPPGATAFDPAELRAHAQAVKDEANRLFWNPQTNRFVACIDQNGQAHDYGFTFVNLDAIWYGIASDEHAQQIMTWITGARVVDGDTSQGADIYRWRFGPRATTKRNTDWYAFVWSAPEKIPWGGQVQDGGAVLGFTFYDLWARLHVLGADNAWARLCEILAWEKEVWANGGYRAYYADGSQGATLQGGGTAGALGIDAEFFESSLLPAIVTRGFLGLEAQSDALRIAPRLPQACEQMGLRSLWYRGVAMDVLVDPRTITVAVNKAPVDPIVVRFAEPRRRSDTGESASEFALAKAGVFRFEAP